MMPGMYSVVTQRVRIEKVLRRVSEKGVASVEDMQQLAEVGVSIFRRVAEARGVTPKEVRESAEAGGVTPKEVEIACVGFLPAEGEG